MRAPVADLDELTRYLEAVSRRCEVLVVDGGDEPTFAARHERWTPIGQHVRPDPHLRVMNGKVHGVLTGVALASHERIVIADDDVRYDADALERVISALDDADLVRPQNYFDPLPWHARWDTARTVLNRAVGSDFPGTLAVRRSAMRRTDGYDGDVLFENLELIRTVRAASGTVGSRPGLYVRRLPPSTEHFWSQRVRQAYDEFARPWRLAAFLAVGPAVARAVHRKRWAGLVAALGASILVAEIGRRRERGTAVFPPSASLLAPVWVAERAVCSWIAVVARARGGCRYGDRRLVVAANPQHVLRRRYSEHAAPRAMGGRA
jgi:hypothetical protein